MHLVHCLFSEYVLDPTTSFYLHSSVLREVLLCYSACLLSFLPGFQAAEMCLALEDHTPQQKTTMVLDDSNKKGTGSEPEKNVRKYIVSLNRPPALKTLRFVVKFPIQAQWDLTTIERNNVLYFQIIQ